MGNKPGKAGDKVKGKGGKDAKGAAAAKPAAGGAAPAPAAAPQPKPSQPKGPELTENDYKFLTEQTGLSRNDVKALFDKFMANNADAKLDKKEFVALYSSLRTEDKERLDEISEFVFRAFDTDRNGFLSFNEFMIAYALTSRGDLRKKLEYAFNLYDADGSGTLDNEEVEDVIEGMLDLLGADKKHNNPKQLAQECVKELDTSKDGQISKDEFINGLLKNYSLRALMSPFG